MNQKLANFPHLNVIVCGRTGVGKSTLINRILNKKVAETGIGKTVTNKIQEYSNENKIITLIDTPCLEYEVTGRFKLQKELQKIINKREKLRDNDQRIHCIWYCIRSGVTRIDEVEFNFMKMFENIPIIIVLTRAYDGNVACQMVRMIQSLRININRVIPVLAENEVFNDFHPPKIVQWFGLNELIHLTAGDVLTKKMFDIFIQMYYDFVYKILQREEANINVVIVGKTGVGKSTLINSVLGVKKAEVDLGKPVTKKIEEFGHKNSIFTFIDTPGLELKLKQQKDIKNQVINIIKNRYKTKDINQFIHCIWYCIRSESGRIENDEKEFINELAKDCKIPIIIVLTQCLDIDVAKEMFRAIKKEEINFFKKIPIIAEEYNLEDFDPPVVVKPFGLKNLLESTKKTRKS